MGTRRLIAIAHEGGYDYVHLSGDGDTAPEILDASWSTESSARELVSGGDISMLAANDARRHDIPGRGVGSANDIDDLLRSAYANEHLISIYDAGEGTRDALAAWNEENDDFAMHVDNADSSGGWMHLADGEEMFQRMLAQDEIDAENARKAA